MSEAGRVITLRADEASAEIALKGAEPMRWRVGDCDLLWNGDAEHWAFRAPILFPVVGASRNGEIRVDGTAYPMPQHGFLRHAEFEVVSTSQAAAHLMLTDTDESRAVYPFRFSVDVRISLDASQLTLAFDVTNRDARPMPYALGFHPAFRWPFDAATRHDHLLRFDEPESPDVPEIAPGGLLARTSRAVPLDGADLPLDPAMFTEALVFLDANSTGFTFQAPNGSAIRMSTQDFPHLAVWTKPTAPFLSLECWTGHADYADASGELRERSSMRLLAPGATARHAATLIWKPAADGGDPFATFREWEGEADKAAYSDL